MPLETPDSVIEFRVPASTLPKGDDIVPGTVESLPHLDTSPETPIYVSRLWGSIGRPFEDSSVIPASDSMIFSRAGTRAA